MEHIHYVNLMILYILITTPSNLVEYIYLVRNKPHKILIYGFLSFGLQLVLTVGSIKLGLGIDWAIYSLLVVSVLRFVWLFTMVRRYASFRFSWPFILDHLKLGWPLIVSSLLSGSAQYIDGIIVSSCFSPETFAIFRYGAKELPFVILLANGLNNGMLTEFRSPEANVLAFETIKQKSKRLMHFLFPVSIVLLFFSNSIFVSLFNKNFGRSSDIFMIYILLITSRLLFPQTILIGLKKTNVVMQVSIVAIIINIATSLTLIQFYGLQGVALATVIVYVLEKMFLMLYNHYKMGIKITQYTPIGWHLFYSFILIVIFVLIDHRIIMSR
jgi:O-antigen/teichoic acid export membrane protein